MDLQVNWSILLPHYTPGVAIRQVASKQKVPPKIGVNVCEWSAAPCAIYSNKLDQKIMNPIKVNRFSEFSPASAGTVAVPLTAHSHGRDRCTRTLGHFWAAFQRFRGPG